MLCLAEGAAPQAAMARRNDLYVVVLPHLRKIEACLVVSCYKHDIVSVQCLLHDLDDIVYLVGPDYRAVGKLLQVFLRLRYAACYHYPLLYVSQLLELLHEKALCRSLDSASVEYYDISIEEIIDYLKAMLLKKACHHFRVRDV